MAQILPSKKQHALLEFIDAFIKENDYAPSYREVMSALDYKSVSTVAAHINGLIERGWLVKRDNAKRSVEVVYKTGQTESLVSPAPSLSSPSVHKTSESELHKKVVDAKELVEIGATYKHYKGSLYEVVDLAIQTTDDEVCVTYRAQYGEGLLFARPIREWLESVELDGQKTQRFNKLND